MSPARHHLRLAVAALVAAALLLSAAVPAARAHLETEHEEEFSYIPGDEHGPERWGSIKKEWAACGTGRMQSPIDLSHERVSLVRSLGYLHHSYRPAEASIVNRGHDIMVRFEGDAGSLVINGTAYHLKQLHWHSPAEHTVDGRRHDMELHLVHESGGSPTCGTGRSALAWWTRGARAAAPASTTATWARSPRRRAPRGSSGPSSRGYALH
jgi:carbonic anhydrase